MSDSHERPVGLPARPAAPRRRWSEAEKRRIVAESYQPGVSVSLVARRNDVNANQVTWRRQYRERGGFVPVVVAPDRMLPPRPDAGPGAVPAADRDGDRAVGRVPGDRRPRGGRRGAGAGSFGSGAAMIPVPGGVRVWLATGVTDMRRGMNTLALQVQESLGRDPHAGDLYVFRGRKGDLLKILRRCPRPDRGDAAEPARRTPPLELGAGTKARSGRITPVPPRPGPNPARPFIARIISTPNSARNTPRSSADAY